MNSILLLGQPARPGEVSSISLISVLNIYGLLPRLFYDYFITISSIKTVADTAFDYAIIISKEEEKLLGSLSFHRLSSSLCGVPVRRAFLSRIWFSPSRSLGLLAEAGFALNNGRKTREVETKAK
jgi:hypothetical protein